MSHLRATSIDANGVTWSRESASTIIREDGAVSIHRLTNGSVVLYRSGWGSTTTLPANVSAVVQALAPEWLAATASASSQPTVPAPVKAAAETGLKAADPNCKVCLGDGFVWDKKAREIPCACRKSAPGVVAQSKVGLTFTPEELGKTLPCNLPAGKDLDYTRTLPNEVKLVTASGATYSVAEALDLLERCRVRRFPDEKPDPKVSEKILWFDSSDNGWWGCDFNELSSGNLWCYGPPVPASDGGA